ncbi:hypothetical protein Tco_0768406 [Tanacetum coccineum]
MLTLLAMFFSGVLYYGAYGVCIGILACRGLSLVSSPLYAMNSQTQIQSSAVVKFGGVTKTVKIDQNRSKSVENDRNRWNSLEIGRNRSKTIEIDGNLSKTVKNGQNRSKKIGIGGNRNKKEHEEHLKAILELLKKEELYAKFSKCEFWLPKEQFLSHVIDSQGIHVDPAKIESIKYRASPKMPMEIR